MADRGNEENIVLIDTENSIILGDYLDLLLNRNTRFEFEDGVLPDGLYVRTSQERSLHAKASKLSQYENILYAGDAGILEQTNGIVPSFLYSGGIRLPHYTRSERTDEGSGNIVISGKPGVGKSTLAFQFAASCASKLNEGIAIYFSLDVDEKQIVKSMKHVNGELAINYLCIFPSLDSTETGPFDSGSNKELEEVFRNSMRKNEAGRIIPQLAMPKLSPRGISQDDDEAEDVIFLQRIEEIQLLLRAISTYNQSERSKRSRDREPIVKLVVVDSLDVFGENALTREQINRLFMLFNQYGIIGVFTMGSVGYESLGLEAAYKAAVAYQADVVIELKKEIYNNYSCSYFEVAKSRYTQHVLGHHPYKIENLGSSGLEMAKGRFSFKNGDLYKKLIVLPSLHYRISSSENSVVCEPQIKIGDSDCNEWKKSIFGIAEMVEIMPNHFKERCLDFPQIIAISGSSGLYKSDIAINALISGIIDHEGKSENGLIVRLGDRDAFAVRGLRFEKELLGRVKKAVGIPEDSGHTKIPFYEKGEAIIRNDEPNKYTLKGWSIGKEKDKPQLMEVTFKNGALLPEEFVDEICKIINVYSIRRVAFIDLKYIGSSYPFLVNSDTSGSLFLSAFVHIMRNYGVHVLMSSSESGLSASDLELKKAGILADAILTCTATLKNGIYEAVDIMGEGLITSQKRARIKLCDGGDYSLCFHNSQSIAAGRATSIVELRPFEIELGDDQKK